MKKAPLLALSLALTLSLASCASFKGAPPASAGGSSAPAASARDGQGAGDALREVGYTEPEDGGTAQALPDLDSLSDDLLAAFQSAYHAYEGYTGGGDRLVLEEMAVQKWCEDSGVAPPDDLYSMYPVWRAQYESDLADAPDVAPAPETDPPRQDGDRSDPPAGGSDRQPGGSTDQGGADAGAVDPGYTPEVPPGWNGASSTDRWVEGGVEDSSNGESHVSESDLLVEVIG